MVQREGTSRSPQDQMDILLSEAQGKSLVPLVPAPPTPVEARGDAVPPALLVSLVLEEARETRPPVPIVPSRETGEQWMREAVQLLTRMIFIHEQRLQLGCLRLSRGDLAQPLGPQQHLHP
ncbi:hypothetical protein R3W88_026776 [Solanum pinnatisectum]|uniref:Uncharacterized protein n=1 Tax=Solanum pinnatisectum TaxID=50273 RepID=A0AAV9LE97_9SOLN|nr:hypothetical protein R3W88_026776 [Solanum pinnatisectum]